MKIKYKNVPVHQYLGSFQPPAYVFSPAYKKLIALMGKTIAAGGSVQFVQHGTFPHDTITLTVET